MSQNRPWQTELSSLVVTLAVDKAVATETIEKIRGHECISVEPTVGNYLPLAIEATNARPIHQWLESLAGVHYVDVVFCSTEVPEEESTSPLPL